MFFKKHFLHFRSSAVLHDILRTKLELFNK